LAINGLLIRLHFAWQVYCHNKKCEIKSTGNDPGAFIFLQNL
jgi:hypothetical protein